LAVLAPGGDLKVSLLLAGGALVDDGKGLFLRGDNLKIFLEITVIRKM